MYSFSHSFGLIHARVTLFLVILIRNTPHFFREMIIDDVCLQEVCC